MKMDDLTDEIQGTHPFVAVRLQGACAVNRGEDAGCTMVGLAADRGTVLTSAEAAFADEVIFSLPHIGILKATVARTFAGGFDALFAASEDSKLAIYLAWLTCDDDGRPQHENRQFERIVPIRRLVELTVAAEAPRMVRLVDLSRSGAAFTSSSAFAVGEAVMLGAKPAKIARVFAGGAAAHFDEVLPEDGFGPLVDLATPRDHAATA